jgi:hypothetical protein
MNEMLQEHNALTTPGGQNARELWIAMIGDMVASRKLPPEQRRTTQERFAQLMRELNEEFASAIAGRFAITQGDEFECLLQPEVATEQLAEIIWRIEERFPSPAIRFGIGLGGIDTDIPNPPEPAILLDGPAFHRARAFWSASAGAGAGASARLRGCCTAA